MHSDITAKQLLHPSVTFCSSGQQNAAFVNVLIWTEIADLVQIQFLHTGKNIEMTLVLFMPLDS